MVDDIIRDSRDELRAALEIEMDGASFSKLEKQARQIADEISEVAFYDIKENMASWLADHVSNTASACIEAILAGNESEARRKLALKPEAYYDGRDFQPWFNHSSALHEATPVEVRRKIVEAHRDLITDARIADLEAQLEGLVKKYYGMEHRDLPTLREKLREAEHELEQWRASDAKGAA
jgi:glutamate synthase domain-containing protein 3